MNSWKWVTLVALSTAGVSVTSHAHACGGVVSNDTAVVTQSQQRVLISYRDDGTSNVVVQLAIPAANAPFGALTPVAGQPTLDPEPVDVAELDKLEEKTRPKIHQYSSAGGGSSSSGCGCGSDSAAAGDGKGSYDQGVHVVDVVDIGPVTAAVLAADSTAPLTQWLTDNGFVVPTNQTATIDAYVGAGQYFIAFKRSAQSTGGESSVGVSFSVPGDQRGYPLRMSRIGAGSKLGIQVFVAAPENVAPYGSAPAGGFTALTLTDLSPSAMLSDYTQAVFDEVAQHAGKAFVVEGVYESQEVWRSALGPKLYAMTDSDQVLTRLTTVVDPATLDADVQFMADPPKDVPREVTLGSLLQGPGRGDGPHRWLPIGVMIAMAAAWAARRLARTPLTRAHGARS